MAVAGNTGGAGGAKNLARAGKRRKPTPALTGSRGDTGRGSRPTPAPLPTPAQLHAARIQRAAHVSQGVAVEKAANRVRARKVRQARGAVPSAPLAFPGLPPEVKHPAGSTLPVKAAEIPQRPLVRPGLPPEVKHPRRTLEQAKHTQREIDREVGRLMRTGRGLGKQEKTIGRLRDLGVLPNSKEMREAKARLAAQRKLLAETKGPKKKTTGTLALATGAASIADKVLSGQGVVGKVEGALAKGAGVAARQAVTGDWYLNKLGLKAPKGGAGAGAAKFAENVGRGLVDVPASVVPSLYAPAKESAKSIGSLAHGDLAGFTRHQIKGARTFVDPVVETAKHPLKSAYEHPVQTYLIGSGAAKGASRGAGFAARKGAAGAKGKAYASRTGPTRTIPGAKQTAQTIYPKGLVGNRAAKAAERRAIAKRKVEPGRMTEHDVREAVSAMKATAGQVTGKKVFERGKQTTRAAKGADYAASAVSQGLIDHTRASLEGLITDFEKAQKDLTGEDLKTNRRNVKGLRKALSKHDPEKLQRIAHDVGNIGLELDAALIKEGVLTAREAEGARLTGPAVRYARADPKLSAEMTSSGWRRRQKAEADAIVAQAAKEKAAAKTGREQAKTAAAVSAGAQKSSAGLRAARREEARTETAIKAAGAVQERGVQTTRAGLTQAVRGAEKASQRPQPTLELDAAQRDLANIDREIAAQSRQAVPQARASGRAEGAATARQLRTARAPQAELQDAQIAAQAARDAHAAAKKVESQARKASRGLGKKATSAQHQAAARGLSVASKATARAAGRIQQADARVANAQRNLGSVADIETTGVAETQTATALRELAVRRIAAVQRIERERTRTAGGVPPAQADVLMRAIEEHDLARTAAREGAPVKEAKAARKQARVARKLEEARLAGPRAARGRVSGRGTVPAKQAADRYWDAIHRYDDAKTAKQRADALAEVAKAQRELSRRTFHVDEQGNFLTSQEIRAARPAGAAEPYFIPHSTKFGRQGTLPLERVKVPVAETRSGEQIQKGTVPLHPSEIIDRSMRAEGMVQASIQRQHLIDSFGYRESAKGVPNANAELFSTKTQALAESFLPNIEAATKTKWAAVPGQDGRFYLIHKSAYDHLAAYDRYANKAPIPILDALGSNWRRVVLVLSTKWLTGQGMEAAIRTGVESGALAPADFMHGLHVYQHLKRTDPAAAERIFGIVRGGGQHAHFENVRALHDPRYREDFGKVLGADLGGMAQALKRASKTPIPKAVGSFYGWLYRMVFHYANGAFEAPARFTMMGKYLRDNPLLDDSRIVKYGAQAVEDGANHLRGTPAQVALTEHLHRAYGKYSGYGPKMQRFIDTYTPFLPWFLNAVRFLGQVMPRDHPMMTGLLAAANEGTEKWREAHGQAFGRPGAKPLWMLGGIPGSSGSVLRLSHYTPMGAAGSLGELGGFILPQWSNVQHALNGEDWQGNSLLGGQQGHPDPGRVAMATLAALVQGMIPGAQQAANIAGIHTPDMPDNKDVPKSLHRRLRKQWDPFMFTPGGGTDTGPSGSSKGPSGGGLGTEQTLGGSDAGLGLEQTLTP